MHDKTAGNDDAKSPPCVDSMAHWERVVALAAAGSPVAANNHGAEFGLHGGSISFHSCACDLRVARFFRKFYPFQTMSQAFLCSDFGT